RKNTYREGEDERQKARFVFHRLVRPRNTVRPALRAHDSNSFIIADRAFLYFADNHQCFFLIALAHFQFYSTQRIGEERIHAYMKLILQETFDSPVFELTFQDMRRYGAVESHNRGKV